MPRDRLDGIRTKEGRVVYDRKPHQFTLGDMRRVVRKVSREAVEESIDHPEELWLVWFELFTTFYSTLFEFGARMFAHNIVEEALGRLVSGVDRIKDLFDSL